jgi:SAM-dependent methyltransferase
MFEAYKDIFNLRGNYYHQAMEKYPFARKEEFKHVIDLADIADNNVVCDVPSGGGYLNQFIHQSVSIISVETSSEFMSFCNHTKKILCDSITNIPLASSSIDRIISLAALHHVSDKKLFYRESSRLLVPDGILCIADVMEETGVAKFLNIFVDKYNSMGHYGEFFDKTSKKDLLSCDFDVLYSSPIDFVWEFDSSEDMVEFCRLLFYINLGSNEQILEAIEEYLGYQIINNRYFMNWELYFIKARKFINS